MAVARTIIRHPTFQVAFWNNVVIANIEGHVDADGVRQLIETYRTACAAYPEGIASITLLRPSLKVGDSDTNAEARRGMQLLRHRILHAAIVIEDQTMLASLLRAVIRTLNSIARGAVLSIASDLEQAVRAVSPHVKQPGDMANNQLQAALLEAVMSVRGNGSRLPTP